MNPFRRHHYDPENPETMDEEYLYRMRVKMVERQIASRGIGNPRVLNAMLSVHRHLFVPGSMQDRAYDDSPLPIGDGQTISQPYMVAWMTELLNIRDTDRILEVGTGSGYQAAILCELSEKVFSIEKYSSLAAKAEERLNSLGYENVTIRVGDGSLGWPEEAPFDGIIVTAGSPAVPEPLIEQLSDGGRLVIPVGPSGMQMLTLVRREGAKYITREEGSCVFVPLVGKFGWRR
ncbi:MAG: protein-L-isoaspartate(D-aspartate) O-methyltransferase [Actinomycetota bacterium]|nr:protein-L-isoaspartate(D-aspartate) O-methyltransferase [Actinomycetota bacterium]